MPDEAHSGRYAFILSCMVLDHDLSHAAFRTLAILAIHADKNGYCWAKLSTLAKELGVDSKQAVRKHLDQLAERGYIRKAPHHYENGASAPNRYYINLDPQKRDEQAGVLADDPGVTATNTEGGSRHDDPKERSPLERSPMNEEEGSSPTDSHLVVSALENGFSEEASAERKLEFKVAGTLPPDVPIIEMVDMYHDIVTSGARVQVLNQKRIGQLTARWKDLGRSFQAWAAYLHRVQASPFLTGQVASHGKEPFAALDIGWITGSENYVKITEGRFDGGKRESRNRQAFDDFLAGRQGR